jgi:uncharacterized protein YdcH (DUF465 family)
VPVRTFGFPSFTDTSIEVTSMEEDMNALVERLIATHRQLNREIRRELAQRLPDQMRLTRLKKHRLATKDQLVRHMPDAAEFGRAARRLLGRLRTTARRTKEA